MDHTITIRKIEPVTHDVLRIVADKPAGYAFEPGQATELSIKKEGIPEEKRPFTFTSLPGDTELEFTIKMYPSHDGMTENLGELETGDSLAIGDSWGAIKYDGPGAFIAGGAGITPFIAILKDLKRQGKLAGHKLFFGNKSERDIIYQKNLRAWLGDDFYNILSEEDHPDFPQGYINREFLSEKNLDAGAGKKVYLCGPPAMMDAVEADLFAMGISRSQLVMEGLE
ncbi:flavodoxin reductase [Robiginitalea sp. SC105]|uniref:flavodoxin reductase n=1 Tax=Robiginitalea sp. SC105 TaxID=2762332 RepID=UPI0016398087|nr:flavodoxin reductase [Robiginitalea sp. SC105]MBC2840534.1 flavodoxin reductase [Robiginitalea sp. SC105]